MKIGRHGNIAICTGAAHTNGRTLQYASYISTEQIGNQIKSAILLGHQVDLTTGNATTTTLYPQKSGYGVEVRALPRSIYSHYVILATDPLLALLLDPTQPAPGDPYNDTADHNRRTAARNLALKQQRADYHKLVAQIANTAVETPILPEWIGPLFDSFGLADTLTCHGDALYGCIVRASKEWTSAVRHLLKNDRLYWPQPPITVTQPEETHATAGPRETRLLPNPA